MALQISAPVPEIIVHPLDTASQPSLGSPTRTRPAVLERQSPVNKETAVTENAKWETHPHDGFIIPPTVLVSLRLSYERLEIQTLEEAQANREIRFNDAESYNQIESLGDELVKECKAQELTSKELNFRHGSCFIVSEDGKRYAHTLRSQEDWKEVCAILVNLWASRTHTNLRLVIYRDYFALQTKVSENDDSYSSTKRKEMFNLMRTAADDKEYIPRTDLTRITSESMVREAIYQDGSLVMDSRTKNDFVTAVQQRARKLLAMCICAELKMSCLKRLINEGRDDSRLPLSKSHLCHVGCKPNFSNLILRQRSFMAAEFNTEREHQALQRGTVVPLHYCDVDPKFASISGEGDFSGLTSTHGEHTIESMEEDNDPIKKAALCGFGAYSKVYRVRIDPDHHRLSKNRDETFALKIFNDRPQKVTASFQRELETLNQLGKHSVDNKHIVTHLSTWTLEGRYYMLFPYAECNLRDYMRCTPFGTLNKENIIWLLRQLRGMADALRQIHDLSKTQDSRNSSNLNTPARPDQVSGWHHDLKPENILYFRSASSAFGTFRIADFGSGKIGTYRSGSINTGSPNGTLTYEPPEYIIEGRTSRPYDMWSMGCVFLELITWAIFGHQKVLEFTENRRARRRPTDEIDIAIDDGFFQIETSGITPPKAVRRKAVDGMIEDLKKKICSISGRPFDPVLELIPKMLEPNRQVRISALHLWATLDNIYKQTKVDLDNEVSTSQQIAAISRSDPHVHLPLVPPDQLNSITGEPFTASPTSLHRALPGRSRQSSLGSESLLSPISARPRDGSFSSTRGNAGSRPNTPQAAPDDDP